MSLLKVTWQAPETYFKIPAHWELKDIEVRWHKLYYKGVEQYLEGEEVEGDCKRPVETEILEGEEAENMREFLG
jgi:hypothetical protein